MSECKQKYIEWSSENGNYCGEYDDGRLIGADAVNEFDGWEAAWSHQQAKIDELQARVDEITNHVGINFDEERDDDQHSYWSGYNQAMRELNDILKGNKGETNDS